MANTNRVNVSRKRHSQANRTESDVRPLTHEERLEVIRRPFPVVHYIERKSWAGALVSHKEIPTEGRRLYHPHPEDEEFGRMHDAFMQLLED